jgi:hypothetical protein
MIPVEDAAGGAALIAQHKSEWTPYEDAYKVENIEKQSDYKHFLFAKEGKEAEIAKINKATT